MDRTAVLLVLAVCAAALFSHTVGKMEWDAISHANTNIEKHSVLYTMSVTIDGQEIDTG